ncbi:MAG TPA: hypothetical protein VFW19_10615 [Allosphingosinicella sp.]|nr:hypothetical protein [Allosphingosinicella sp.]
MDATLNATTLDLLGDTITYTPFGQPTLTFKAIADYQEKKTVAGVTSTIESEAAVEVPIAAVAAVSGKDVVTLPRLPGLSFNPKQYTLDEGGLNWLILLKKVPA